MENNVVVVFTPNNARILRNPPNIDFYKSLGNALVNPNLDEVKRYPPHFWKKVGDRVALQTPQEREDRMSNIQTYDCHNTVVYPVKETERVIVEKEVAVYVEKVPLYIKLLLVVSALVNIGLTLYLVLR